MTVSSAIATATLAWTGAETTFTPGFQAQAAGDVSVVYASATLTETLVLNTHYTLSLDSAGFVTVTRLALPAAPATLTISRNSSPLQDASFADGQPWSAKVIGGGLDLGALRDQELRRDVNLALAQVAALQAAILPLLSALSAALPELLGDPAALPTAPPAGPGLFWINGGVLCVTPGGANPLPTTLPASADIYWNNGGVVSVS